MFPALTITVLSALPLVPPPMQDGERQLGVELAAVAGARELPFEELDDLLIWRHGRSPDGRAALRQLLELSVLRELAEGAGIVVDEGALQARMAELDREIRASGVEGGLSEYLAQNEVDADTFRQYLTVAILHEALTRRALGKDPGEPLSGEEQTAWLAQVLEERGYEEFPHPWPDGEDGTPGIVARSGALEITRAELARHLRTMVPRDEVEDACFELLLEREVRARVPDLADEALARAVEEEIERRRADAEADPRFQGVGFERLLDSQGLSLEELRRDPAVRVAALARIWVDRRYDGEELRRIYEEQRDHYDGLYGEALELFALQLRGSRFKNDLNPRTFEEAEAELVELKGEIGSLEDFQRLAALRSEDPGSRAQGGRLGFVCRATPAVPQAVRVAAFDALDQARALGQLDGLAGSVLGPLRLQGGAVLVALGERRPAPAWDTMAEHVHRELRRKFLEEALARGSFRTWLD